VDRGGMCAFSPLPAPDACANVALGYRVAQCNVAPVGDGIGGGGGARHHESEGGGSMHWKVGGQYSKNTQI